MRVAILLTAVLLALTGCTDSPASEPSSALGHREDAERVATDLDATAVLVAVFGPEWANESFGDRFEEESPEAAALNQGADDAVGDGQARVWGFLFETETDPLLVALDTAGNTLYADSIPDDSGTADSYDNYEALGDVNVDSPEAASIVLANNARFAELVQQPNAVVIMALGQDADQGVPFWVFTGFTDSDEEDFAWALVNALDGSYMDFDSMWPTQ